MIDSKFCLALLTLAAFTLVPLDTAIAADPIITTFVGGGTSDGQPALNAGLTRPLRSTVDGSGNIYFSDSVQRRVFKIEAGTGTLRVFAGDGSAGVGTLPATALNVGINEPSGMVTDAAGNLYLTERGFRNGGSGTTVTGPCRVLKVDISGNMTVLAGTTTAGYNGDGVATSCQLKFPTGITLRGTDLYICDQENHRIRKLDSLGNLTTVVGNGTAGFSGDGGPALSASLNQPNAVAFDSSGNMYISDEDNHRIRKVNTTNTISTVAGTGVAGFSGDGASALSAKLNKPGDVKVDSTGRIYIADSQNRRIRLITGTNISTIVGSNNQPFGENVGGTPLALNLGYIWDVNLLDASGTQLLVTDFYSRRIWKINRNTDVTSVIAGDFKPQNLNLTLANPGTLTDIAFDRNGNSYLTDSHNHRVLRVHAGTMSVFAGNGKANVLGDGGLAVDAGVAFPESVIVDGNFVYIGVPGRIWRVSLITGMINSYTGNGVSGNSGDGGPATLAHIGTARGLTLNANGDLYFIDSSNNSLRVINRSSGIIERIAGNGTFTTSGDGGPALNAGFAYPRDLAILPNGDLIVADQSAGLRLITKSTGLISSISSLIGPWGITADGDGNLYVSSQSRVFRAAATTWATTVIAGDGTFGFKGDGGPAVNAWLATPLGLAIDSSGKLFIADSNNCRIRQVASALTPPSGIGGNPPSSTPATSESSSGGCGLGSGAATTLLLSLAILVALRQPKRYN